MKYIRVRWKHSFPEDPVLLYSELDNGSWEVRKVEVYRDGTTGYADKERSYGSTKLGLAPVPDIREIAQDPQFEPAEINRDEFEQAWRNRSGGSYFAQYL